MNLQGNFLFGPGYEVYNKVIRDNPTIAVDAGANIGGWTIPLAKFGWTVHAFEVCPNVVLELRKNCAPYPSIIVNDVGLSDKAEIKKDCYFVMSWMLTNTHQATKADHGPLFDAKLITLDSYFEEHPIDALGHIKLDVDGYEPMFWRGARKTITKFRPTVMVEISCLTKMQGEDDEAFCKMVYEDGFVAVDFAGKFAAADWKSFLSCIPEGTSFDIFLLPQEKLRHFCPAVTLR